MIRILKHGFTLAVRRVEKIFSINRTIKAKHFVSYEFIACLLRARRARSYHQSKNVVLFGMIVYIGSEPIRKYNSVRGLMGVDFDQSELF